MKVLIVASYNKQHFAPFIVEQAEALRTAGVEVEYYGVVGKGIMGYLRARKGLLQKIRAFQPDIIHAHFGLSGLLANLQRRVPVVTTYHGCDINVPKLRCFSSVSLVLSKYNIFVSAPQRTKVNRFLLRKKNDVIPCGVNTTFFVPQDKNEARKALSLSLDKNLVLFSGDFARPEKNSALAHEVIAKMPNTELIELRGYTREQVVLLMNAVDAGLMTSIREGSPMFVKELVSCHTPVVTTLVGDVHELLASLEGTYITSFDVDDIFEKLNAAIAYGKLSVPEAWYNKYENIFIAQKIKHIYENIVNKGE